MDTVAPAPPSVPNLLTTSDTGISNSDNVTGVTTPTFVGKAEANATVTLFDGANATVIGQAKANSAGAWSITTVALAAGVHAISARATDQAGNASSASGVLSVTIDTTSPTAPTTPNLTPLSDSGTFPSESMASTDNITNRSKASFSGKTEAGAHLTFYDGAVIVGTGRASTSGAWSVTTTALSDGVHAISAQVADRAGNVSALSGSLSVTIDTKAPLAPGKPDLTAASDNGISSTDNITSVTTTTFVGTATGHATITLLDGTIVVGSTVADAAGAWSITTSPLAVRQHIIKATATDLAGNVSAASSGLVVTIDAEDTTAPDAPTTPNLSSGSDKGRLSTDNITNTAVSRFIGSAEPASTVTLYDGVTVVGTGQVGASGTWIVDTSVLSDGVHAISATATDRKANVSVRSAALNVTIDTVTPTAPTRPDLTATSDDGVSSTDNITTVTTPTFTGKAEALALITLLDGATVVGTSVADAAGIWSVTTTPLAFRAHSIRATATDVAGNVSVASSSLSVTIDVEDTTAPDAPTTPYLSSSSDHGRSNTDDITNAAVARFHGKAEPGATVTLYDGVTIVGTGRVGASGSWIVDSRVLSDGNHAISATATDRKGNVSVRSAALTVTIDTMAPLTPGVPDMIAASDTGVSDTDNITGDTTPTFSGMSEGNALITLFDGATALQSTIANGSGAWSVTSGAMAAGSHALTAKATDMAGNVSAGSGVLVVNIDLTARAGATVQASASRTAAAAPRLAFLAAPVGGSTPEFPSGDIPSVPDLAGALSLDIGIEGFALASVAPVEPVQMGFRDFGQNGVSIDISPWGTETR